jgi:hypothetical protein
VRPTYPVLIVSERPSVVEQVGAWLDGHLVDAVADPAEASRIVATLPLAALIVDAGGIPREASRALVRDYAAHQPAGRVAILAGSDDITTLVAFTFRDPRVDMFFAPWDAKVVTTFLQLTGMPALASV